MSRPELFPHQVRGAQFLARTPVAGLFFGMGTGKTLTALEAAACVEADRIVIVGPPISLPMWTETAEEWLSRPARWVKTGNPEKDPLPADGVITVSYSIAAKRYEELGAWLAAGDLSIAIFDESHALKTPKAKRTQCLLGRKGMTDGTTDFIWCLTGTPITRWNDDLFTFLARADLKGMRSRCGGTSLGKFKRRYTIQQERSFGRQRLWMTVANRNTHELAEWTYTSAAMRVDLEEVYKSMPPLTTNTYTIPIKGDPTLTADLKELEGKTMGEIREMAKKPELATIRRRIGIAKVPAAAQEIIARIESGQTVLIGAWHSDVIDALGKAIGEAGHTWDVIDGRRSADNKQAVERAWNDGEIDGLICQIGAAGVSLNLQRGGSQIIVVEEDWSPTIMDQFYARLWRYGQQKPVHVDILRSDTRLDQALARIASAKAAQAAKHNEIGRALTDATEENHHD